MHSKAPPAVRSAALVIASCFASTSCGSGLADDADRTATDYGRITKLLIARHGRLAFEEYFNGCSAEQPHTMQSVTKSVVSLLTGAAASTGSLSVGDAVTRFVSRVLRRDRDVAVCVSNCGAK